MKVLHVLYQSLPHISGSTIRSRDLIESQSEYGIETIVVTSPFQKPKKNGEKEFLNGIPYYRTFNKSDLTVNEGISNFFTKIKKATYIFSFTYKLIRISKKEKPDIIHAHATFFTAFAAKVCSKLLKIPFVYEVRSLWDERQKQLATTKFQLAQLKVIRRLENAAINSADAIVTINESLKQNLASRTSKDILVVKNAAKIPKTAFLSEEVKQPYVFGYLGSITVLEGLVFLVSAFTKLRSKDARLIIFGDGPEVVKLKSIIDREKLTNVELRGSFSPEKADTIYQEINCIINPRIKNKLSETVTPLKPLEALAYKKLFVGSDVGGIKELIKDKSTGLLFNAENEESLLEILNFILDNRFSKELQHLIDTGFEMVKKDYSWNANSIKYDNLYQTLVQDKNK